MPVTVRRQPKVGTCIFCGAHGPLEGEHVIAQWVRKALGVGGNRKQTIWLGQKLQIVRRWQKPIATRPQWCVCHECNHGWMKDLEDAVQPQLAKLARQGVTAIPDPVTARMLVAWAFKTAAVAQEMEPNRRKPIDAAARDHLRVNGEPPSGTRGWILPCNDLDGAVHIGTFAVTGNEVGYAINVVVGSVRLALIGPWRGQELRDHQPSPVDGVKRIPIWPQATNQRLACRTTKAPAIVQAVTTLTHFSLGPNQTSTGGATPT